MARLKCKREISYKGKVYDLTVENTHSYNIGGIPVHNSVGGSLVAYLIGITDVDPIRFGLIFERFINPSRLDLPDIDLDFMSSRREEVMTYLVSTYGQENVAGISNYGELGSSSSIRSVGSAFNLKEQDFNCSKQVPKESGQPVDLDSAKTQVPEIDKFSIKYPEVWDHACALQGTFRSYGRHAAGVIVSGEPIENRAVLENRQGVRVVNWDKRVVEDFGLVKLDVLGLQTLDILSHAKNYIKESSGEVINYIDIPLDAPEVMQAFGEGKTIGVFQFESGGMRTLLKNLAQGGQLTFEDVVATTALFRPGPIQSGLMDSYVNIKQGTELPNYPHPSMEPALEETYSVIVYQEQVMQIARDLAGFTMAESDGLRKAMGKKDADMMSKMKEQFVAGCDSHSGMNSYTADMLFDQIEKFAGYAFNKSHSVEYAVISYWAMWLKTFHPDAFYAAALTVLGEDKLMGIVKDSEEHGIFIVPPDINKSSDRFEIGYDARRGQKILYSPFQAIKGLSEKGCAAILKARSDKGGSFQNKKDFIESVNRRVCNIRVQEALDKVGAFAVIENEPMDSRHPDRLKDQKQMLPGLISNSVKADRKMDLSPFVKQKLGSIQAAISTCEACSLCKEPHALPRVGRSPKIMMIADSPNWSEVSSGKMCEGKASSALDQALKVAGLTKAEIYFTSVVKAQKPKGAQLQNEMIIGCSSYLDEEIETLKPPVIVTLGTAATRHLLPDLKGTWEDLAGQQHYRADLDATIVCGFNYQMVYFDPNRQNTLDQIFCEVAELID